MKVRFWGTRGSIPAPGPETVRYGGNTTCIEVLADGGSRIVLDGGTGIRGLGLELAKQMPLTLSLFISHTHWDHIQGLPFFVPLFVPGNHITIHGPPDPVGLHGVEAVLTAQMAYPHFPVRANELAADVTFTTMSEGVPIVDGPFRVTTVIMNHPALAYGFRVECDGQVLGFTGDHEPYDNIYDPGDEDFEDYQSAVEERNGAVAGFFAGADLLIADGQYTLSEYSAKKGWGHSTYEHCLDMARKAGVRRLCLTHHETTRSDEDLDDLLKEARDACSPEDPDVLLAAEGKVVDLGK